MVKSLEMVLTVALSTPMGDPTEPNCVMGLPVHIQGDPGIGKSDRVEDAARDLGLPCGIIYPSTLQPEDISGALIPDGKGGARSVSMLATVNEMIERKNGVIFIDELTGGRPAVQSSLLGFVLTRRAGDIKLPPGIRIIAASNPPESAAGGWDLEPPMANRFAHFAITPPSSQDWANWLLSENREREVSIRDYEDRVKRNWGNSWPKIKGLFVGFMKTRGELLWKMPKEGSKDRSRAWASPRTWYFAARAVATCSALGIGSADDDMQTEFVSACVGEAAAVEWSTWRNQVDLPEPHDVLMKGFTPDKKRLDRSVAVYTGMAAYITGQKDKDKKVEYAVLGWERLREANDAGLKDLGLGPAAALTHANLGMGNPKTKEAATKVLRVFGNSVLGQMVQDIA